MLISLWLLIVVLSSCANAVPPPIVSASDPADSGVDNGDSLDVPQKRILKYLLPSAAQGWGGSSSYPIPTGQEGTKRGYVDRNFLRFGRSDAEKRNVDKNFLRFGRGDNEEYDDESNESSSSMSEEKRNRNFIRFGRDPDRNFLRFGRPDLEEYGLEASPLALSQGLVDGDEPTVEEKRAAAHKQYIRYGRGNHNFLRFGRNYNKNFLRFGRSVNSQTFCEDCEEDTLNKHSIGTSSNYSPSTSTRSVSQDDVKDSKTSHSEEPSTVSRDLPSKEEHQGHRSKRSAPAMYDYAVISSHSPASWARGFIPQEDIEVEDPDLEDQPDFEKRSNARNFIRYGRNRNFIRFGKRDSSDNDGSIVLTPGQYPRYIRAPNNNFIRFG